MLRRKSMHVSQTHETRSEKGCMLLEAWKVLIVANENWRKPRIRYSGSSFPCQGPNETKESKETYHVERSSPCCCVSCLSEGHMIQTPCRRNHVEDLRRQSTFRTATNFERVKRVHLRGGDKSAASYMALSQVSDALIRRKHGVGLALPYMSMVRSAPVSALSTLCCTKRLVEEIPGLFGGNGDAVRLI